MSLKPPSQPRPSQNSLNHKAKTSMTLPMIVEEGKQDQIHSTRNAGKSMNGSEHSEIISAGV